MDDDDGRWLSYVELAALRGISRDSAERLVRRKGWRRQADNQGNVRILVPNPIADGRTDSQPDIVRHISRLQESFDAVIEVIRADLDRERSRADRAEAGRAAERSRADELRGRVDDLGTKLAGAQAELATAQDQVEAANALAEAAQIARGEAEADAAELRQAEAERRARGVLARLRAAWRGE